MTSKRALIFAGMAALILGGCETSDGTYQRSTIIYRERPDDRYVVQTNRPPFWPAGRPYRDRPDFDRPAFDRPAFDRPDWPDRMDGGRHRPPFRNDDGFGDRPFERDRHDDRRPDRDDRRFSRGDDRFRDGGPCGDNDRFDPRNRDCER